MTGDSVCISGKVYLNLTVTASHVNSSNTVRLGVTRGEFMTEYINDLGGFRFSFEGLFEKMTFYWQDVSTGLVDVMFFGQKSWGSGHTTRC